MSEQMQSIERYDSEQQFQTHSRSRNKQSKNIKMEKRLTDSENQPTNGKAKDKSRQSSRPLKKKKNKKKRFNSDSSSKSESQSEQPSSGSSNRSKKRNGLSNYNYFHQNKISTTSKEKYNRVIKPSQTLIQKPQINDPQLDQSMEKILFKLTKDIKPKNSRKFGYQQPIQYDPSLPKAFSKDAFSFRQEPAKTINKQFFNNPFMPPSLRTPKDEKASNKLSQEYQMTLQQLPLKKSHPEKAKNIKKQWFIRVEQNEQSTINSTPFHPKPEVLFDKQEIEQFLCGLGSSK